MRSLQDYILHIERVGLTNRNMPSTRIVEHMKIITAFKGNISKIEQDTQSIIKDVCISLRQITIILQDTVDRNHVDVNHAMIMDEKDTDAFQSIYGSLNFGQAIQKIITNSNQIITDFRMDGILELQKKL